ncbi:hypothetical protein GCM10008986_20830 [Salinibacillus aidingensis]|uniref:SdpI/YhfL protein family protein n=1 Tax=Salinibacillus aidingensis TaxID=237684 RepID=A0ABN1BBJ7_9BACI
MDILLYFVGPVIAVLIVNTIMSVIYKDVEKKDKGFALNYHKLTYRRRFIRALWGIPFVFIIYLVIYWLGDLMSIIGIIFLFLLLIDTCLQLCKMEKECAGSIKYVKQST